MSQHPDGNLNLLQLKKQAKELLRAYCNGETSVLARVERVFPRADFSDSSTAQTFNLSIAQCVLARENGFASWAKLKAHVEAASRTKTQQELDEAMIRAANKQKDLARVEALLNAGANVNGRLASVGTTALGWAGCGGHVDILEFLLARGADVNMPSNAGFSALNLAAHKGQTDAVKVLLAHGAEVNAPQPGNWSALHDAAYGGNTEIVKLLLESGSNVNLQTTVGAFGAYWFSLPFCGESPLHNAMAYGDREMIEFLLAAGANPRCKTRHGETPFHWAGRHQKQRTKSFMAWLQEVHASVNV